MGIWRRWNWKMTNNDRWNSDKDEIDDGEDDDFKELAQELNKEKGLGEPVQQGLANFLETVWQNSKTYEKIKDKMRINARPETVVNLLKNTNKKFGKLI